MKKAWTEATFSVQGNITRFRRLAMTASETGRLPARGQRSTAPPGKSIARSFGNISVVPKPFSTPHPTLWQAFSFSPETLQWCAAQDLLPWILVSEPRAFRALCENYRRAAAASGRALSLGQNVGAFRMVHLGQSYEAAYELGRSALGAAFVHYFPDSGSSKDFGAPEKWARFQGRISVWWSRPLRSAGRSTASNDKSMNCAQMPIPSGLGGIWIRV